MNTTIEKPELKGFTPKRLITLLDMIRVLISQYALAEFVVSWQHQKFGATARQFERDSEIDPTDRDLLLSKLKNDVRPECEFLGLSHSLRIIEQISDSLTADFASYRYDQIETQLLTLLLTMRKEVGEREFAFIPPDRAEFFERDDLFGVDVSQVFDGAKYDIKEAGNCISGGLNTATIFHLMRVAEVGLRALAKKLRVKIKNTPIEYAEWGKIIEEIEKKITALKPLPRGKRKAALLEYYHGAMGEFNAFKDVWRNNIMHTRRSYNGPEAMGVYLHVRSFMQRLATKLK